MQTEHPSPRFTDIDLWQPSDVLEAMIGGQFSAVAAVRAALPEIERAGLGIEQRLKGSGRLIYAGAGTSGRLAVQDGAELMPTFSWPRERLLLLIAGGDEAMMRAVEGAEDEVEQAAEQVRLHKIGADDVLVAVAASGTTPFTLSCLREAKRHGAFTVGIANNRGTAIIEEAEQGIFLDSGAEPIAGSTRMNAGTAQRITLNLLSTLVMIRLGRIYRGMMVDVQSANVKLEKRKKAMVGYLTGKSEEDAQRALERAAGNVKLAVLLLHGGDLETARAVLESTGGRLRQALTLIGQAGVASPTQTSEQDPSSVEGGRRTPGTRTIGARWCKSV
jgi:N-acetylmuramic acid 6-phosphate etherase